MKKTRSLALTGLLILLTQSIFSQAICGFDAIHKRTLENNPAYRANVTATEAAIHNYILQHPQLGQPKQPIVQGANVTPTGSGNPVVTNPKGSVNPNSITNPTGGGATPLITSYTIPVVVHVIHTGGAVGSIYNPSDAQITGAIDYLNAVYNGTYPGTQGAGDLQIQFAMAKRDPNCNPTNGINRVNGSGVAGYTSGGVNAQNTIGADEINVKNLSRWDPNKYYNVWVVDKIDGNDGTSGQFIAGYAYFPGAPTNVDGIVMLATQMIAGQKTLPHEIGHAFYLYHPFEGSTNNTICPSNNNCNTDGDQVCDTDPISENMTPAGVLIGTCRTGANNTCTNTPYTINTESNYMNYSTCYTLFTAGQKARMLAAVPATTRINLANSDGATTPDAGANPCPPKINFELTGDEQTETTATTINCRSYKDYTYNVLIGVGPTVAATATITFNGGTATRGTDYDITTNGSFTSPSTTINFPAGSTTAQSFILRIYDDASVNGQRTVTLGLTVGANGGNAVLGNGRPTFTMKIDDNDNAPLAGTLPIGTASLGSNLGTAKIPFNTALPSRRAQFLYKASELTAAGVPAGPISGLAFMINAKHTTKPFTNLNIKLGKCAPNYMLSGGTLTMGSSMTVVKSLASFTSTAGWNIFTFDNAYTWDGTSNIVVEVCFNNGSSTPAEVGDDVSFYTDGGSNTQCNALFQDTISCNQAFTFLVPFYNGQKPRIQFLYGIPTTAVQTVLNSSMQQYLGPNADVYFYDQTNQQLMARIHNNTSHDYGCTQLLIDRAGTSGSAFWYNTTASYLMSKTFKVIPTTNNTAGSYDITLFYTQSEIDGWQTLTGQTLSNIQVVKVGNEILDVTPSTPNAGGAVVIGTPTITSLGTHTALTYHFTTGFSGFGAGVPGIAPLPLGLLDFSGRLQQTSSGQTSALLTWSTSFESNTRRFGIERATDTNASFKNIGYIDAAGNSTTTQAYNFTDRSIQPGATFYRLREEDLDGKFTYSKTIRLDGTASSNQPSFSVLPNPFTNTVDLQFGAPTSSQIRLLDIAGRPLYRTQTQSQSTVHLDLSSLNLAAGIYLLEVRTGDQTITQKLQKTQ